MTAIHTLLVLAATVAAEPRGEVLDFSATWGGPCQQMNPIVSRLEREGLPIRKVDVDQQRSLAQQFNVRSIPTFILVIDGEEVTRIVGGTTESELRRMLARIPQPPPEQPRQPDLPETVSLIGASLPANRENPPAPRSRTEQPIVQVDPAPEPTAGRGFLDLFSPRNEPQPPEAIVRGVEDEVPSHQLAGMADGPMVGSTRIRVTIDGRINLGSGAIIGSRPGMTLVLTCGHIFRGLNDDAKIEVDIFETGAPRTFVGTVEKFDLDADVGLISIPTDRAVPAVTVCAPRNVPAQGDRVACIGCSGGDDPSREQLQVTAINKYTGPDNIECTGIPVQGRSGGGLFNVDGELIGVCIAADPEGQRGLYAHVHAVHKMLDECGLTALYQPAPPAQPEHVPASPQQSLAQAPAESSQSMQLAASTQPQTASPESLLQQAGVSNVLAGDSEIVVIIRSKDQPQAPSRVVIINQASPAFFAYLNGELGTPAATPAATPSAGQILQTTQTVPAPQQPEWYETQRVGTDAPVQTATADKESLRATTLSQPPAPRPYVRSAATR
jgi:thiol-disulfide isomerase/thioredoxin